MTDVDRAPTRTSGGLAVAAGGFAVAVVGSPTATAVGVVGVGVLGLGVFRGRRGAVTIGAFLLYLGVLIAGLQAAAPEELLLAGIGTVIAWDVGEQSINVGEQLGRAAPTARGELVHAAGSTIVGVLTVSVAYLVFSLASGGQPLTALVILLAAAIALVAAVRD